MPLRNEHEKPVTIANGHKGMDPVISQMLSLLRISAAFGIFIYHFSTLSGNNIKGIFLLSIYIFCFLSGYLSYQGQAHPLKWLLKRIYTIMIPYWFVIIPVLVCNRIISYKETSVGKELVSLLGGSLFLDNPVYIISWYVTLVLLFYFFFYLQSLAKNVMQTFLIWSSALLFFELVVHMIDFFAAFSFGLIISGIHPPPRKDVSRNNNPGRILFFLQDKCYAFFLIHGGVLLLLFKSAYFNNQFAVFISAFLVSVFGAVLLRRITQPLIAMLVNRTESAITHKTILSRDIRAM